MPALPEKVHPAVVIVRDGWGRNPHPEHNKFNAVHLAKTPVCDQLLGTYPWTLIHTSGEDVGLPEGTMGNSEVGHQNLGAGRIVDQESVRITKAIRTGEFFDNPAMVKAVTRAKKNDRYVHLLGIGSDVGVHGLLSHLYACVELCKKLGHDKVALHLFTDGRDSGPYTGLGYIRDILAQCEKIGCGRIASLCGRYYAMDRDNRWERVKQAYDLLTGRSDVPHYDHAPEAMQDYYDHPTNDSQQGDEFVTPRTIGPDVKATRIADGDSVIFYNYRGDRPREIIRAFVMPEFQGQVPPSPDSGEKGFDRGRAEKLDLCFVTMTAYEQTLNKMVEVAYPKPPKMTNIAGQYVSDLGLKQFRAAETEKFPHVTFFFNDYREPPFEGESRQMAQSPKVATYDLQPQMSANQVCDFVVQHLEADQPPALIVVNFANGDMVGHTGKLDAAIAAVQTVDACVGRIIQAAKKHDARVIVTADHGNAEQMFDPQTNAPHTAHTTYDVECILVHDSLKHLASGSLETPSDKLSNDGRLADVLPTALKLMGLTKPGEMTGQPLF